MRLSKFIAENTGLSRRRADELIAMGKVEVAAAGQRARAVLGQQVSDEQPVFVNGKLIEKSFRHNTILLNKPVGYLSSRRSQGGKPTVYDLLPTKYQNLKTAGRLDVDSSGLMLLSSDGDLIQRLTHPKFQKTKVYEIVLDRSLQPLHQQMISDFGIDLPDGKSKLLLEKIEKSPNIFSTLSPALRTNGADRTTGSPPESGLPDPGMGMSPGSDRLGHTAKVEKIFGDFSDQHWRVTMHEGRNRQIRRTFAALGYNIKQLHRTQLGPYRLGDLKTGKFREITVKLK